MYLPAPWLLPPTPLFGNNVSPRGGTRRGGPDMYAIVALSTITVMYHSQHIDAFIAGWCLYSR
jgi:hypothetical protein